MTARLLGRAKQSLTHAPISATWTAVCDLSQRKLSIRKRFVCVTRLLGVDRLRTVE